MENMLPLFVFISVASLVLAAYLFFEQRQREAFIKSRLLNHSEKRLNNVRHLAQRILQTAGRLLLPKEESKIRSIKKQLACAGYRAPSTVVSYFGCKLFCISGFVFLFFVLRIWFGLHLLYVIIFLALGYSIAGFFVQRRIQYRNRAIFKELPDILDLLVTCIEAGLGFEMALLKVSEELKEVAPVLSRESAQYFYETRSGVTREQALMNLKERNAERTLKNVVNVLIQSARFGTDITDSLRVYSKALRVERMQLAEERGAKLSVKLTIPLILLILPALLLIMLGPAFVNLYEQGVFEVFLR